MIGFYDYTTILTYLSLLSAGSGIVVSLSGKGHPYIATFFLLFCGLCDAFDGKVARLKKNRTEMQNKFGIQIDSLSDLVAFGVLPACIGASLMDTSMAIKNLIYAKESALYLFFVKYGLFAILILYILAALIRLAYFNVTEEERQKKEKGVRKTYTGLPVTTAALIFPAVMLLHNIIPKDISIVYFMVTVVTGFAFLAKFEIRKPGLRGILLMVLVGAIEFFLLILFRYVM